MVLYRHYLAVLFGQSANNQASVQYSAQSGNQLSTKGPKIIDYNISDQAILFGGFRAPMLEYDFSCECLHHELLSLWPNA